MVLGGIWIYLLSVFKRKKLNFFYFITGSAGLFMLLFFPLHKVAAAPMARFVCYLTGIFGRLTGMFKAYSSYGILFIENAEGPVSLYVDFECAGLVEILVFVSLIVFFQVYKLWEKALICLGGIVYIMAANILRLFSICCIIHFYGNKSYYLAHTIVGRLIFYGLSVIMYFYIFTRTQIRRQRIGEFDYDSKAD